MIWMALHGRRATNTTSGHTSFVAAGVKIPKIRRELIICPQVVRWARASGTTGGKGEVPSQGSRPISSLFSCRRLPFCHGAGQQDSSGYSLAKEGWLRPSTKYREATLAGRRRGWLVQPPNRF